MILTIPYKALSKCNLEELAYQQASLDRIKKNTGGVYFARKEDHEQKDAARQKIIDLLSLEKHPEYVSILSMPGLSWKFEVELLRRREKSWRNQSMTETMHFTCLENDRFIYYSACTKMPGNKEGTLRTLPRPDYAERAMGNGMIDCYAFANIDDVMKSGQKFDFVWLDYTGPLSVDRMKIIKKFWSESVNKTLVVTSLKARWNKETSKRIHKKGGALEWLKFHLKGNIEHEIEYQDGASPMVQFAVSK